MLAALLPFLLLAAAHWSWAPPAEMGDFAQYLSHARALAEGRSYSDIGYLYHPSAFEIGPPSYPPGFSVTLVPIVALLGTDTPLIRLLMVVFVGIGCGLAAYLLSPIVGRWQAATGAGIAALAMEVDLATIAPLSDPGFMALFWAVGVAVHRAESWNWKSIVLVTALGFATIFYRQMGIALIPALGLYGLLTWRAHRGRALVPPFLWGVVGLAVVIPDMNRMSRALQAPNRWQQMLDQFPNTFDHYRQALLRIELYPLPLGPLSDGYHIIASVLVLVGLVLLIRNGWRTFAFLLTLSYGALLAIAPVAEARYLWPLYPVVGAALASGVGAVVAASLRRFPELRTQMVAAGIVGLILVAAAIRETGAPRPPSLIGDPDAEALFAYIRNTATTDSVRLAVDNPRVVTLETRVPAMGLPSRTATGQLKALEEYRITHLVLRSGDTQCLQRIASELVIRDSLRFQLEYTNPKFRVYRFLPGPAPADTTWQRIDYRRREQWCQARAEL